MHKQIVLFHFKKDNQKESYFVSEQQTDKIINNAVVEMLEC